VIDAIRTSFASRTRLILILSLRWSMNRTSSATRCRQKSEVSLLQKQITIDLVIKLVIEWTKQALLHACSRHESIVSLLQWQLTWFSNESLIHIFYDLSLFTTLMTTAKMICTADRVAYTICLERIEHILYVWKHKDMSWNSFIVEYLKLNRKNLLEWQE